MSFLTTGNLLMYLGIALLLWLCPGLLVVPQPVQANSEQEVRERVPE